LFVETCLCLCLVFDSFVAFTCFNKQKQST
jgi:hypothetical protein